MNPCRATTAAALLLGAFACGRNAEETRFDAIRASCQALAAGATTIAEANRQFGFTGATFCPATPLTQMKSGDQCPYQSAFICKGYWASVANDSSLCNLPFGGCFYWCEVRFPGAASAPASDSAVICGAWFVSGQPYLPPDFP
jgi:hypothetical protein